MEYPSQGWRWKPPKLGRLLWQLIVILTGCKSCPITIIFKNTLGARSLAGWASVKFLTFPNMCGQSPVANWYQLPFWQPVHGSSKWANYCPFWLESNKQVRGVLAAQVQGKLCRKAVLSLVLILSPGAHWRTLQKKARIRKQDHNSTCHFVDNIRIEFLPGPAGAEPQSWHRHFILF